MSIHLSIWVIWFMCMLQLIVVFFVIRESSFISVGSILTDFKPSPLQIYSRQIHASMVSWGIPLAKLWKLSCACKEQVNIWTNYIDVPTWKKLLLHAAFSQCLIFSQEHKTTARKNSTAHISLMWHPTVVYRVHTLYKMLFLSCCRDTYWKSHFD